MKSQTSIIVAAGFVALASLVIFGGGLLIASDVGEVASTLTAEEQFVPPTIDKADYDRRLRMLAHIPESSTNTEDLRWPVKAAYPELGAILPFRRIVAYYGNFYSKGMGVLGEYSEDKMLEMLKVETDKWEAADPSTPVTPAIDYIAITAQLSPGKDGNYRARMPHNQIDKALAIAEKIDAIVILEVQPGKADLLGEIKSLEPYLIKPNVHLAIDPEFAMRKSGARPGTRVGTVDATEVNAAAEYLAGLVRDGNLPPKVMVVHRYTRAMVTNTSKIIPLPEVQIVMDMDGWGGMSNKISTYEAYIKSEPVQFTGFKLFYKHDKRWQGARLMTPAEILKLTPSPSFIQYQ